MTADQRLDQLEPIMAQSLATLGQHTAQNERHTAQLKVVINSVSQQSENIVFLLGKVAGLESEVAEIKGEVAGINSKLDLILERLSGNNK